MLSIPLIIITLVYSLCIYANKENEYRKTAKAITTFSFLFVVIAFIISFISHSKESESWILLLSKFALGFTAIVSFLIYNFYNEEKIKNGSELLKSLRKIIIIPAIGLIITNFLKIHFFRMISILFFVILFMIQTCMELIFPNNKDEKEE